MRSAGRLGAFFQAPLYEVEMTETFFVWVVSCLFIFVYSLLVKVIMFILLIILCFMYYVV